MIGEVDMIITSLMDKENSKLNEKGPLKGAWIEGKYLGEKTIQDLEIESTETKRRILTKKSKTTTDKSLRKI